MRDLRRHAQKRRLINPDVHGDYKRTWVDKTLNLTAEEAAAKPWYYHAWTYPTAKLMPAIGRGVAEGWDDTKSLFRVGEIDTDPLTGLPRERSGADMLIWQMHQMVSADFDLFWDKEQAEKVANYYKSVKEHGEDSVQTQMFAEVLAARNKKWADQSFAMSMTKDFLSKYGSWEAFADTLYNRPDKILVDMADMWSPKLPAGIVAKLRKATPDNANQIIDEILDYAAMPEKIDIEELKRWNDDEDIFFRLTTRGRLGQEHSLAIGESEGLKEKFHWETVRYLEQRNKLHDPSYEPILSHADVFDDTGDMIINEDRYKARWQDEYEGEYDETYWEIEEAYWERFQDLAFMEGVTPIAPITIHESMPSSPNPVISEFRYEGVNATHNLNQLAEYERQTGWTDFIHDPNDEVVIEVITGFDHGEALGGLNPDSIIVDSPKRIAVINAEILDYIPEDEDFSIFSDRFLDIESTLPDELVEFLESMKNEGGDE